MQKRVYIETYGCQMNEHDSERILQVLEGSFYGETKEPKEADLILINTCSVREKPEHKVYSAVGRYRGLKEKKGTVIGVAGCVAQQQGDALLARFPQLDFVYGPHNLRHVPAMVEAARQGQRAARTEESASLARFDLPDRHPDYAGASPGRAFVTVMEGCDMFCSFCVVPRTRGREISRPAAAILAEARRLAESGRTWQLSCGGS